MQEFLGQTITLPLSDLIGIFGAGGFFAMLICLFTWFEPDATNSCAK